MRSQIMQYGLFPSALHRKEYCTRITVSQLLSACSLISSSIVRYIEKREEDIPFLDRFYLRKLIQNS